MYIILNIEDNELIPIDIMLHSLIIIVRFKIIPYIFIVKHLIIVRVL